MFTGAFSILTRGLATLGPADDRQAAALCWRPGGRDPEFLLISTRRTGRWTPPKGGLMDGKSPAESAAIEAWEEAGARGEVSPRPLGIYETMKLRKDGQWRKLAVEVFALRVEKMERDFPEKGQRRSRWMDPEAAAAAVREPALRRIIRGFHPAG